MVHSSEVHPFWIKALIINGTNIFRVVFLRRYIINWPVYYAYRFPILKAGQASTSTNKTTLLISLFNNVKMKLVRDVNIYKLLELERRTA